MQEATAEDLSDLILMEEEPMLDASGRDRGLMPEGYYERGRH